MACLSGGEPTVRDDLPKIIEMGRRKGFAFIQLNTNGLLAEKRLAIARCGDAGLGVVLVPMVVPGVNDQELGEILDFGVKASPVVLGIHVQPVSYFGRRIALPQNCDRITLPEILTALETQSRGMVRVCDFHPPFR